MSEAEGARMRCKWTWKACMVLFCIGVVCNASAQEALRLGGEFAFTHDPSIAKCGSTYYVFATGKAPEGGQLPIRCSEDLTTWRRCGHVFDAIPAWIHARSPGTEELWAPDISFEHGEYRLYYAYSLFGKNTSGIALAVNKTLDAKSPDYKWVDRGLVLESKAADDFNAIDPNYIEDAAHHAWLAFGSFWGGIKMHALDEHTGLLSAEDTQIYALAARSKPKDAAPARPGLPPDWQAIEAPFIVPHDGYYYLFVSFDLCCMGAHSNYRIMVGRSRSVTGPYVDRAGVGMIAWGGTELLTGNRRWVGPGGQSVLYGGEKPDLFIFHAYDAESGRPALQISTLLWRNGWPEAALSTQ